MKPRHSPKVSSSERSVGRDDGDSEERHGRAGAGREEDGRGRSAEKPREIPKRGWKDILWRTKEQLKKDNLSIVSGGVAFYIFLGVIPALGAVISIWGLVADPSAIKQQISSMGAFLPQDVITILDEQMSRIASRSAGATLGAVAGILLAVWSGAKAIKAVIMALNIAYEEKETRGFIRLNLTALALTLAGMVGFMIAVATIVVLPPLLKTVGLDSTATALVSILRWPLLAVFAMSGLAVLYRYGPDRDEPRWRWVSWGAFLATVVWLAVSAGFSFYVSNFGNYNKTYGSLGAVVVVLLWLLISAYVVLLGAELDSEMEHQTERDTTEGPEKPRGQRNAFVADHVGSPKHN